MSPQPTTPTLLIAISFRSLLLCEGARQRDPFHEVGRRGAYGPQRPKVSRVSDRNGLRQTQRAGLVLAALGAARLFGPAPPTQASAKCDKTCQAGRQAHKQKLALLRQKNKLQKRPN